MLLVLDLISDFTTKPRSSLISSSMLDSVLGTIYVAGVGNVKDAGSAKNYEYLWSYSYHYPFTQLARIQNKHILRYNFDSTRYKFIIFFLEKEAQKQIVNIFGYLPTTCLVCSFSPMSENASQNGRYICRVAMISRNIYSIKNLSWLLMYIFAQLCPTAPSRSLKVTIDVTLEFYLIKYQFLWNLGSTLLSLTQKISYL